MIVYVRKPGEQFGCEYCGQAHDQLYALHLSPAEAVDRFGDQLGASPGTVLERVEVPDDARRLPPWYASRLHHAYAEEARRRGVDR